MPALEYKIEYFKGKFGSDEGAYLHLRSDVSSYCALISKEAYFRGQGTTSLLATELFTVPGVVRLALQSFRVFIEKSPVFTWEETLGPVVFLVMADTGTDSLVELLGSGITLTSVDDRRDFT